MRSFRVYVGKNLSRDQAMARFKRKTKRDWRGWSYSKSMGWVTAI